MATIDNYDMVFNGCTKVKESLESLQSEIFENMEMGPFKEYLLSELSRIQMVTLDTLQAFTEGYCQDPSEKQVTSTRLQEKINAINESLHNDGLSL